MDTIETEVNTLAVIIDTFCATNCEYCNLPSRAKNPARYGYEKLNNLVEFSKPKRFSIFGGDLFYDHDNIRKAYGYFITTPIEHTHVVSEIQKLERDFDISAEMTLLCKRNGKRATSEFSLDLEGKKSGNYVDILNDYARFAKHQSITFNCVLRVSHLIDDSTPERIVELLDTYQDLDFYGNLVFNLDYNAALTNLLSYEDALARVKAIQDVLVPRTRYKGDNILPSGIIPRMNQYNGCYVRGKASVVMPDGNFTACYKFDPALDMPEKISALDITYEDYLHYCKVKHEFNYSLVSKECYTCEARPICSVCPKKSILNKDFDTLNSDTCSFYKSLFKLVGTEHPIGLNSFTGFNS